MGQTTNYGLKQWESWERVKRGEVNGVIAALDALIGGKSALMAGSYTGTAESIDTTLQTVELPCVPVAILGTGNPGYLDYAGSPWGFFLMQGDEMKRSSTTIARLNGSTLQVGNVINSAFLNLKNTVYRYIVLL